MKKYQDHFFKQAKADNYSARSVYKLEEIDRRKHIIKKGMTVLDLGCAPGSWSQYASKKVGNEGKVFGIDLSSVDVQLANFRFAQCDINNFDPAIFSDAPTTFDVVLSDMAPKTTGIKFADAENSKNLCLMALNVATKYLHPRGVFLTKIFQGVAHQDFLKEVKAKFKTHEILKPKAVRSESKEIYIYASQPIE